jgi:hypothetical protein
VVVSDIVAANAESVAKHIASLKGRAIAVTTDVTDEAQVAALIDRAVSAALEEDLGLAGDLTSQAVLTSSARAMATLGSRESGVIAGLDLASARQMVQQRQRGHWSSLNAAQQALAPSAGLLDDRQHSVRSQYFEVHGRMRIDQVVQQELALVRREGGQVRMLWRMHSPQILHSAPLQ